MSTNGKLTPDHFGFSMPVDAPAVPHPLYTYRGASMIVFEYETDRDAALGGLPSPLAWRTGRSWRRWYSPAIPTRRSAPTTRWSRLHASYQGKPVDYPVVLYVTTDAAMAAGREMGGFPKKIGRIPFTAGPAASVSSVERPEGLVLASATFRPGAVPIPAAIGVNYASVRTIPSPVKEAAEPSLRQLLMTNWVVHSAQIWPGTGEFVLPARSEKDPLQRLPLVNLPPKTKLGIPNPMMIKGELSVNSNTAGQVVDFLSLVVPQTLILG